MTRYERWQLLASVSYLVLFGSALASRSISGRFFSWYGVLALASFVPQLLFHLAVWRNWHGIVDEQIIHEQDRAMANGRSYLPGTAQRRSRSLQRVSMWIIIMLGLLFSFFVVFTVLAVGGWLG